MRSVEVCRRLPLLAAVSIFFFVTTAHAINLVEEFYLPMPEPQILQGCKTITPAVSDTSFATITSVLVTGNGTQIYYDQWEDGYETNLALPTQPTTQIWGDGNDANGICPGFTNDPAGLPSGTVIILSNSVPSSPRDPSQYYYDGRDRISANKALVVTRAGWPSPTGPVFGGSMVVQPTIDWGTNYVSPVGQDMTENLFKYTAFFVMASQNNTVVIIDPDGAGPLLAVTNTLNQGESWFYTGGVRRGGTINATKPVEAHMVCGDTVNTFAIDWFNLYPQSDWSSSYYTPVPSVKANGGTGTAYSTYVYLFNNTAIPITIFCTNLVATNSFTLPANGGYKFTMPLSSGAVFASAAGEKFTTLCTVAGTPANDTDYNWGFTPLPKGSLTTEAFTGWAPGTADYSGNGSPVWVTPTANTRIYVDYHGDHTGPLTDPNGNKYDTNFDLTVFQSKTIYVPGTNDQTGLRVYTIDGTLLSCVWGEDPAVAGTGNPYLDLGNPVLPFPVPRLTKSAVIVTDVAPTGLSIGDTLLYTVQVDNKGLLPLGNTVVVDAPPPSLSYVSNSATFNGVSIPDSSSGTAFPLDAPGYTIPIILSGGTSVIQYKASIVATGSIQNAAGIPGYNISVTNIVPATAPTPSLFVSKTILSPASGIAGVGQVMQFNLQVINNGTVTFTNLSVTDNYPSNKFSFVSASGTPSITNNGIILWTNLGTLATGAATNLIVSLLVTNTAAIATNIATASSAGNTTNSGSVTFTNIAAPTPAVTVNKTLLSPASGAAGIGQTVSYNVQVYNSGYAVLTNLSLTDNFPRTNFNFVSASVTPNLITSSNLTWTNLGSFASGYITNITVNFTVTNFSTTVSNFAVAASVGGATNTGGVGLALSRSGLTVTKTLLSPLTQPVNLGSNVVFRIIVQNSGAIAITNVPLEDTFSASYFQYLSATIPPNSIAPGDLFWTNLAGPGGFPTNTAITNDVTMKVTGGASPAYNTAAANFATDVNNASVAPASSTLGVNTAAGSISGNAYNDPDQSGTLTGGDTPLQGVDLSLYNDPNGDGNPADGTLLQTVTSDVNGYYELLNLSTGAYVVVQTVLPGYTGTGPANNRRAVVLSSLTSTTNQNFFQFQVPTTNYASVGGTVWKDATGVFHAGDLGVANAQIDLVQDLNTNGFVDAGESAVQTVFSGTNGVYSFTAVVPGRYVILQTDPPDYINTGDIRGANDNQISINVGSGVTTNGNDFFDNNPPVAAPDVTNTFENVAVVIQPLLNDDLASGPALTITNVAATNGVASIIGGTNVLFTPALYFTGTATIGYTITNANGKSTSLITITVAPVADVRIGKAAASPAFAGSNLVYVVSVTNGGPAAASSVTATDTLPATVTFMSASGGGANNSGVVTWSLGTLSSNQVTNVTVTVTVPASGILTNVASAGSPTIDTNLPNNVTPPVITPVTLQAALLITKVGPTTVLAGSNFSYTISVTNGGPSTASSVTVTDTLPATVTFVSASGGGVTNGGVVTWNFGTLTNSQTSNVTVTVTAPLTGGNLTNVASAGSPTGSPTPSNNVTPPVITGVTPIANLAIGKTGAATVFALSNLSYTISVTNLGPSSAGGVLVTDTLPVGVSFVSASGGGVNNSGVVTWNFGTLTNNQSSNVTVTVTAPPSGTLTNVASVGSPVLDTNVLNNVTPPVITTVTTLADTRIGKTAASAVFAASNLVYTISVTNFGPSSAASVIVTDTLPVSVSFVSATGGGVNNSGVVTWSVGTLTSNQVTNVTVTVKVPATGTLTNVASVGSPTGDPVPTNGVTPPVVTTVTPLADLSIAKVGPASVLASSNFSYTITVTNAGPSSAASVTVTDTLPATVTFVSANSSGVTNNVGVVVWSLGTLSSNQVTNVTVTVTSPTSGTLTNVASVGSPTGDPTPTNNVTPPIITPVTPVADVSIVKVGPAGALFGTNYVYTLTVSNGGPSIASSLSVTDNLPTGLVFISSVPSTTTNGNNQVVWNLGNYASGAVSNLTLTVNSTLRGSLTNTATVGGPTLDPVPTNNVTPPVVTSVTNNPPLANPDLQGMIENTTGTFSPLTNDVIRTPGGVLTLIGVSTTNGTASLLNTTNISFTPTNNYIGLVTLIYTMTDNVGGTNSSTLTINVTNIPPVANPDSYTVGENAGTNSFSPLLNDIVQTPGGSLSLVSVTATNGNVGISGNNVLFAPSTNFIGITTLIYTITDNVGGTNTSFMTFNVTNHPPIALGDSASTPKNVAVIVPVLVNDTDPDNDTLTIISVSPTNGIASISGTNVIFTPTNNFLGTTFVGYMISDGFGGTNSALISVLVTNRAPVAAGDSASTPKNVAVTVPVLANDSDPDGDVLTIIAVSPTNGIASISGTNVVFTPTNNFLGTTFIGYTIRDNFGGTNSALITVLVTNRVPVTADDFGSTPKNVAVTVPVLANDSDPDGDTLTIISVSPTNGIASISGTNVVFTPTNNFLGTAFIGYTVTDGFGGTNSALITINVTNRAPVAVNDPASTPENIAVTIPVLGNDSDPDGDTLTIVSVSPTNGTAVINGTNVVFTPSTNFVGTATVGYSITDGFGGTNTALITIAVTNRPPVANPDGYSITENTTNIFSVLTNDVVVTPGGSLTIIAATTTNGTVSIVGTNLVFTPGTNFLGTNTINYTIIDNVGGTNSTFVTVVVTNIPPIANPDGYTVFQNSTNTFSPLTNDVVLTPGGTLAIVSVTPTNGTAVIAGTNITFKPTPGFTGTATIGYTITDSIGGTNSSVITINVLALADIAVSKVGPVGVFAGANFDYVITVTNLGPGVAANLSVTDNLPATITFVSATPGTTLNGSQLVWANLGSLAANATTNPTACSRRIMLS